MVRFKIGLSRFINRLSLTSSLKLLVSETKTSKSSKKDYNLKMKKILSVTSKFHKLFIDQNKVLNHIVNIENRIISVLKKLKDKNQFRIRSTKIYMLLVLDQLSYMVVPKYINLLRMVFHLFVLCHQILVHVHIK